MATKEHLKCVISGSFKFKPEIDRAYDELEENGINVLGPDKGWLFVPHARATRLYPGGFRPLPTERGMSAGEVEGSFLGDLSRADLVYLMNLEGYVGLTVALEMGYAVAAHKPIYARENFDYQRAGFEENISLGMFLRKYIRVVPVPEIVEDFHHNFRVV